MCMLIYMQLYVVCIIYAIAIKNIKRFSLIELNKAIYDILVAY